MREIPGRHTQAAVPITIEVIARRDGVVIAPAELSEPVTARQDNGDIQRDAVWVLRRAGQVSPWASTNSSSMPIATLVREILLDRRRAGRVGLGVMRPKPFSARVSRAECAQLRRSVTDCRPTRPIVG